MNNGMSRRDFMKYSMATGVLIAAGESTVESVMADAPVKATEVDKLTIWSVVDNYYDLMRPDNKIAKRYRSAPGKSLHAEHGLCFYAETVVDGKTSACMFDYALDPAVVMNNIALLGLDIGKVNAFGLSHGHWDHYGTAVSTLKHNQSRITAGTPFYVGEEAFAHRFQIRPGATEPSDIGRLQRSELEAIGLKVVEVQAPTQIIPGAFLSGKIERHTSYEKVPLNNLIKRGEKPEVDDMRGEQALFFNVKGKGLVVITGCAHSGIVNTVRHAQKVSGTEKVHAIMGGFHLVNAKPEIIQSTISDINAIKPDYIVPGHCIGFEALEAFHKEMPDAFTINTSGSKYTFGA
jgi:7,8-dihydropterin-6-yl-methyl-4-(beta-D-ribofuranosyl)aminobenzene 5'-phosphate synthase